MGHQPTAPTTLQRHSSHVDRAELSPLPPTTTILPPVTDNAANLFPACDTTSAREPIDRDCLRETLPDRHSEGEPEICRCLVTATRNARALEYRPTRARETTLAFEGPFSTAARAAGNRTDEPARRALQVHLGIFGARRHPGDVIQ